MKIELFETEELADKTVESINNRKKQHAKHVMEGRMKWFEENIGSKESCSC